MFNRLYVHVPFCIKKCDYCSFVSETSNESDLSEYPELLLRELKFRSTASKSLDSIYFGGGTPSLLKPEQISNMLERISDAASISAGAEITLEANPGTVDEPSLKAFRQAGVNRISLGVQSFDDSFLKILGRIHTAEQSRYAFRDIRASGFDNVSIDLMHSLPGQSMDLWHSDLLHAVELNPEHISVYGLTVEKETPFALSYPEGSSELPDDDLAADMFELADELLGSAGFEHYEIGNYSRKGYRSEHNSGYWRRDGYLGLGVAAHSFLRDGYGIRYSNPSELAEYRRMILSGELLRISESRLTKEDAMEEFMFLGLRLKGGIDLLDFRREFAASVESLYGDTLIELCSNGLLSRCGDVLSLTPRGVLLSNQVLSRFLL